MQKLRSGGPAWSALDLSFEPKQKIVPTTKGSQLASLSLSRCLFVGVLPIFSFPELLYVRTAVQCLVRVDASVWTGDGVGNLSTVAINVLSPLSSPGQPLQWMIILKREKENQSGLGNQVAVSALDQLALISAHVWLWGV